MLVMSNVLEMRPKQAVTRRKAYPDLHVNQQNEAVLTVVLTELLTGETLSSSSTFYCRKREKYLSEITRLKS